MLRVLPGGAIVLWSARTLAGAAATEPQWRYVPVRRLEMFIEASIVRGLQWAELEDNGEPLWAKVRERVENFVHGLFLRRALQGRTPQDAYFVRCDESTMSPQDVEQGVLVVKVGFAPLRPAEFVIITIRQSRGNSSTGGRPS